MTACRPLREMPEPAMDGGPRSPTAARISRRCRARLAAMFPTHDDALASRLRVLAPLALLALLLGAAPDARAQSCNVTVPAAPAFGQYDPIGAHAAAPNDSASGSVRVECNPSGNAKVAFSATLNLGQHSSGALVRRLRSGAGGYLGYQIYLDAARGQVFGDGSSGASVACTAGQDSGYCTGSSAGSTRIATFPIFGRMPGGQAAAPGSYTDTLGLTITF